MQYNHDRQLERYMLQFVRIMSNWEVSIGTNADGTTNTMRVPARLARSQRQVEQILKRNSENTVSNAPQISCYITGIEKDDARRQNPTHVSKLHLRERAFDAETNTYGTDQGNAVTVERLMPTPYILSVAADCWTTQTLHKDELFEQIAPLFNPSLELQHTDNFVDWTAITTLTLETVTYSSKTIPFGAEEEIDFLTFAFTIPIWISVPAKVKKLGVITKIIASVFNSVGDLDAALLSESNLISRQYVTPGDYSTLLLNGELHLINNSQVVQDDGTTTTPTHTHASDPKWAELLQQFGTFTPGVSRILLLQADGTEVSGTLTRHATDQSIMLYNTDVDTTPSNTETAITAIIDPLASAPDSGLVSAATGQRYLILDDIGEETAGQANQFPSTAWMALEAKKNDIIEYSGSNWFVAFEAATTAGNKYVTNLTTLLQYKFSNGVWTKSFEGSYGPGLWTLMI